MQDIIELSEKTSFSRRKCEKVLIDKNNDMQQALQYLMKLRQNPVEIIIDNLSAYVTGERGKKFSIYDDEKNLISFPAIFAILFLIFFDVASWIIAAAILFIIAFDMNFKIESSSKKSRQNFTTVAVSDYRNSTVRNKPSAAEKTSESEYNEITIE